VRRRGDLPALGGPDLLDLPDRQPDQSPQPSGGEAARLRYGCARRAWPVPDVEAASDGYFNATIGGVLDPSGVVKGWAIERVSALLSAAGVRSHAVNGGGDVQLTGARSDGSPWRIGVAHPLRSGALATVVEGRDFAVATSGCAERGCHILDPRTGRAPVGLGQCHRDRPGDHSRGRVCDCGVRHGRVEPRLDRRPGRLRSLSVIDDGDCWATSGFIGVGIAS